MIEEKIIVGENTKYPLNGLLTLPDNITNPVPAVVFVHGSGASNMDEKVGKPFRREVMRTYGASVTPSPSMETAVGRKILAEHPGTTGSRRNGITPARTSDWKAESAERRSYRNQSTWFPRPDAHPFPRRGRIAGWCRQTY